MRRPLRLTILLVALALPGIARPAPADAQTIAGCTPRTLADPPRTVFECAGGIVVEAEAAARIGLAAPAEGAPQSQTLEVEGGAALFRFTPGERSFQIRTPHAIASVRGTVYAVDVTPEKTALFVQEGRVHVRRRQGRGSVTLRARRGVEVGPGRSRLVARRWSEPRIRALLSRLGQ